MKKGCLLLIAVWVGVGFLWFERLQATSFSDKAGWIGAGLGLLAALFLGNIFGVVLALRQKNASSKTPAEWTDGELICVSGQIRAIKEPVISPLSGKFCSLVEYEIKRENSENENSIPEFRGMLMTPSVIQTMRGGVKVVGFPLIGPDKMRLVSGDDVFERAAVYLAQTEFKVNPKNPVKLLKELAAVLADNDGEVKADFRQSGITVEDLEEAGESGPGSHRDDDSGDEGEEEDDNSDLDIEEAVSSPRAPLPSGEASQRAKRIADGMRDRWFTFKEVAVENGTEVTVFGSYRSNIQAVDISGGLNNLSHQFHFGQVDSVVGRQLRNSVMGVVIWGAAFVGGHWYFLRKLASMLRGC